MPEATVDLPEPRKVVRKNANSPQYMAVVRVRSSAKQSEAISLARAKGNNTTELELFGRLPLDRRVTKGARPPVYWQMNNTTADA